MQLKEMHPGQSGVIAHIDAAGMRRLFDLGFFPGAAVQVVRNAPFKDPMECTVDGRRVSVRRAEVDGVEVTPQ